MKEVFIKGTNKRYSINELGHVFSHYRKNNQGKIISCYKRLSPCFNTSKTKRTPTFSPSITLHYPDKKRCKFIKSLMVEHFNLTPPDQNHNYVLHPIDGNNMNNSIKNLQWKIRTIREWNYEPKAYSKNGIVTHKVCGCCGEKRTIDNYTFSSAPHQKGSKKVKKYCYRNMCEPCRSLEQVNKINADPIKYAKAMEKQRAWSKTEAGKKYYSEYRKKYGKKKSEELMDCYVRQQANKRGIPYSIMNDTVVEILRTQLEIKRECKN